MEVLPLLRDTLADLDEQRLQLTEEQSLILRTFSRQKRAAIAGAAGTGKTVLAVQKARMLAAQGARVLLLCYNRPLGIMLGKQFSEMNEVSASSFHQFCDWCVRCALKKTGIDYFANAKLEEPLADAFGVQYPLAAYYAIEALGDELKFDAVIVDEGQDFGEDFWLPLEMVLKNSSESWLYVFYDENQQFYERSSSFPIREGETFSLYRNCRNTQPIHKLAYRYYVGEEVEDSGLDGDAPKFIEAEGLERQAKIIARQITRLIHDEKVSPKDIGVLFLGNMKKRSYEQLARETLPKPARWAVEEHFVESGVVVDTIKRFKGLEKNVIFLWMDSECEDQDRLMYVGISRAKSELYVVGGVDNISRIKNQIV